MEPITAICIECGDGYCSYIPVDKLLYVLYSPATSTSKASMKFKVGDDSYMTVSTEAGIKQAQEQLQAVFRPPVPRSTEVPMFPPGEELIVAREA